MVAEELVMQKLDIVFRYLTQHRQACISSHFSSLRLSRASVEADHPLE